MQYSFMLLSLLALLANIPAARNKDTLSMFFLVFSSMCLGASSFYALVEYLANA